MGELNTMSINFLVPEKCRFYINPNGFTALRTEDKDYRSVNDNMFVMTPSASAQTV